MLTHNENSGGFGNISNTPPPGMHFRPGLLQNKGGRVVRTSTMVVALEKNLVV